MTIYTIGHSTRTLEELITALKAHRIEVLVDIRAFPMSRRLPHFNRESLQQSLPPAGLRYLWQRDLGGRRPRQMPREQSPNAALRNQSFRNYADYMLQPQFQRAAAEVVALAGEHATAIMCAERLWFHCHRMLVADYLVAQGHRVLHIEGEAPPREHALTREAQVVEGRVEYRGDRLF